MAYLFRFLIVAYLLLLPFYSASAQWAFQSTGFNDSYYKGVTFFDANNGVVTSIAGSLYRTTDGGMTWTRKVSNNTFRLSKVNSTIAYSLGLALFKTTNAGSTWSIVGSDLSYSNVQAFQFLSDQVGIAVGDNGAIWRTTNGGTNWSKVRGGYDNSLYCVHFRDANNGWAAGKLGGLYNSTDGGKSWVQKTFDSSPDVQSIFFVSAQKGWAIDDFNVYATVDGGTTWSVTNIGGPWMTQVIFLDENHGWIAGSKLWNTTDGGLTWNVLNAGTFATRAAISILDENNIWAVGDDQNILTNVRRVYITYPNGGESFQVGDQINITFENFNLATVKLDYSIDGGNNWLPISGGASTAGGSYPWTIPPKPSAFCLVKASDPTGIGNIDQSDGTFTIIAPLSIATLSPLPRAIAGTNYSVQLSATGGTSPYSWSISQGALPGGVTLNANGLLSGMPSSTGNYSFGITVTDANSETDSKQFTLTVEAPKWVKTATSAYIRSMVTSGQRIFAGGWGQGVLVSTDNGATWATKNQGLTDLYVVGLYAINDTVFAGIEGPTGNGDHPIVMFRSTDSGENWTPANNGLTLTWVGAITQIANATIAGGSQICYSLDNGMSWKTVSPGLTYVHNFAVIGSNLFAGTSSGVFVSTDKGLTWKQVNAGLTSPNIYALGVNGMNLLVGTYGSGVFLSSNNGTLWTSSNAGAETTHVRCFLTYSNYVFMGTDEGVYSSTNGGGSWTPFNTGMSSLFGQYALGRCGSTIVAGTPQGIWWRSLAGTVAVNEHSAMVINGYLLDQNYPNPFNPSTTIQYEIPKGSTVRLTVYDILGRQVATLVNELKQAGRYEANFNGNNLASGVYIYRLQAGEFTQTRKFVLTK